MAQAETRAVKRCTYTPIVNRPEVGNDIPGFTPKQPFALLAAIRTVFDDAVIGREVIGQLTGSPSEFGTALRRAWDGNTKGAIAALSKLDRADVLNAGFQAIDAYERLFRKAEQDVMAAGSGDADEIRSRLMTMSPLSGRLLFGALSLVPRRFAVSDRLAEYAAAQRALAERKRDVLRYLDFLGTAEPVGFLHLERLTFTPEKYVRGELVYSVPLVPGETVRVSHREWSRTETEYATLVATSQETAREDILSEKSELTESTTAEQQHTSALNTSVTASGGFGPMQVSTSVGYNAADAAKDSETSATKHAQEITKKAASRSKEEHKISFRVTTTREQEDVSFRELTNTTDKPVRWDYHRLMTKWRVDLYRYDVRLTYDVILPEPGSYLLRRYIRIAGIDQQLREAFELTGSDKLNFHGSPNEIRRENWEKLSEHFDVALDPPPVPELKVQAHAQESYSARTVGTSYVTIELPEGYRFTSIVPDDPRPRLRTSERPSQVIGYISPHTTLNKNNLQRKGETNSFDWRYTTDWSQDAPTPEPGSSITLGLIGVGVPTKKVFDEWQQAQYARILDAAKARFEARRQRLTQLRESLVAKLDREDALSLRRMEREEVMKGVLRWVVGHNFDFYPPGLPDLDLAGGGDLEYYSGETGRVRGQYLDEERKGAIMTRYQQQIRFLQNAIEWENVNYILYPYFWTDTNRWSFKQDVYHPDFEHRAFLRAGAARVVLTLRPSFEKAFLTFMETGELDELLDASHPYITVAEAMKNFATTNDRYTTPANEEKEENKVDTWYEFTPTGALDVVLGTSEDGDGPV